MWKFLGFLTFFLIVLWILYKCKYPPSQKEGFQAYPIKGTFMRGSNALFSVDLELARTSKEIEQGLMNRTFLPPNSGMLFWFENEAERAFWMHKTLVPLDMIFVTSAGRITNIIHSAPPKNDTLRKSTEPVQYVVELPGGTAEKYSLQAGDRFLWTY